MPYNPAKSDYCIINISQNTENSPEVLRKLDSTKTPVINQLSNVGAKNSLKTKIIIGKKISRGGYVGMEVKQLILLQANTVNSCKKNTRIHMTD